MGAHFANDWEDLLQPEFRQEYYLKLHDFLRTEYQTRVIYPDMYDIFNAMHFTPYSQVKAVILGQDPYHGPGQAHGLSFSVKPGIEVPPSLQNIYKELQNELGCYIPHTGYLKKWADQGVLLLNAVLTVRAGMANSHRGMGWEFFTDDIIRMLNRRRQPVVFLLWGRNAREKKKLITEPRHLVLEAAHPSPLSAYNGFFGCGHFKRTNEFLVQNGIAPIDWQIEDK
ncbi:MAG: uracil-DNA glycosylase [Firmicutes bacterium]|nr:uracil-DNA glycosylase [Bacillota bacterium]MBQ5960425.1 uracil-DNA glycosylase [Bacillota bacterium]